MRSYIDPVTGNRVVTNEPADPTPEQQRAEAEARILDRHGEIDERWQAELDEAYPTTVAVAGDVVAGVDLARLTDPRYYREHKTQIRAALKRGDITY